VTKERNRQNTKRGPGRMPHTRTAMPSGSKLWGKCPDKKRDLWMDENGVWADPRKVSLAGYNELGGPVWRHGA
jgi:hypothetical protein